MAEEKRDYYEVLGISKTADDAEIKKAYRVLAKKYHPDMNPGDAEAEKKFKEASEAYAILSDPEKRRQYDQFGHAAFDGGAGGGGFDFSGMDFGDIFGDLFGGMFGGGFGGSRRSRGGPQKGANTRVSMRISFVEAAFGVEKEIEIPYKEECSCCHGTGAKEGTSPVTCTRCGGKGQVVIEQSSFFGTVRNVQSCPECNGTGKMIKDKCPECRGAGYKSTRKKIMAIVPAGIDNGQAFRISGMGEPGSAGGARGDVLVETMVYRHPVFQRDGANIYSTVPISFAMAALGGEVLVDTLGDKDKPESRIAYTIKPGTQTDTRVVLKGKGIPHVGRGDQRGNHYVTFVVETPEKLSSEAKDLLRKFDELTGDSLHDVERKTGKASADGDDKNNGGKKKKKFF
ncbi:MAG: molecular chaperone DnaJ [Lachnospiraceae bacterium]|nr:molecular chaperone DnaJ [Candidatus Merdinaster equi]